MITRGCLHGDRCRHESGAEGVTIWYPFAPEEPLEGFAFDIDIEDIDDAIALLTALKTHPVTTITEPDESHEQADGFS